MKFEDLKFIVCKNGNKLATISFDNGYQLDIIKKMDIKVYKVKPFEIIGNKKYYQENVFPEYKPYPIFVHKDLLMTFLIEIRKHNLEDIPPDDLDEDITED